MSTCHPGLDILIRFSIFSDPDFEAPDLTNISGPDHFEVIVSIIDALNISSDSLEEEDWDEITRGAIDSHQAQVNMVTYF